MKQLNLTLSLGTFIESINKTVGANSGFVYHKGDRGLALKGESGDTVIFTGAVAGVKTITFGIKKSADSKIILDNVTDKLEITGGSISGTGLTQCYVDGVDTNVVGNDTYHFVIAEFSAGIDFSTNVKIAPSSLINLADKIILHDTLLSVNERADAYRDYLSPKSFESEIYPRYGSWNKKTDSSQYQDQGLLLHYNMIRSTGDNVVDISNSEIPGSVYGPHDTLAGLKWDGRDDYLAVNLSLAPAGTVKTIAFRIKLKTTSEMIYEGQSNDILILANAGTLEASDFDHIYVDGVESAAVVAGKWHNIVVTSSTAVDNSTPTLGRNSGTFVYGSFEMEDFQEWSTEWGLQKIEAYHNSYAKRPVLVEKLTYVPVGDTLPREWETDSGTFVTAEDLTSKYISCTGNGVCSIGGVNLSKYYESGLIKILEGDLSADQGDTVDDATNVAFTNGRLRVTMTSGQKLRKIIITEAEEQ